MSSNSSLNFIDDSISLEGVYEQCNEHLREQDRKRDQLIGFYGAIIGLLLSNLDKLIEIPSLHWIYLLFIFSSWMLGSILINYLKWHSIYNYSAITLQNLMFFKQENITQHMVNQIFYNISYAKNYNLRYYFKKTETKILNLYLFISCINHYIFVYLVITNIPSASTYYQLLIILATFVSLAYIFYINYLGYTSLKQILHRSEKVDTNTPIPSWCINLYQYESQIKEQLFNNKENENATPL